jgi:RNA polymerase sigma-70 factor, ECF subfamily
MDKAASMAADERPMVNRLRRYDSRAWREVFLLYRDRIYGLCHRMLRNRLDPEDAAQEVFERAVRSIGGFRGDSSLSTWLYRIATNTCLTRLETAKRSADTLELSPDLESGELAPDRLAASGQLQVALSRALGQLDPLFRAAIHLRDLDGRSYEEIAEIMEIPIATVKTRIHRGRTKLQQLLVDFRP